MPLALFCRSPQTLLPCNLHRSPQQWDEQFGGRCVCSYVSYAYLNGQIYDYFLIAQLNGQ